MDRRDQERSQPAFFSRQVKYVRSFYLDLAPPADARLAVVCGGFERCHPDYVIDRATFQYLGLEFVASGTGQLSLGDQQTALVPGLVFCYGPGVAHRIVADQENPASKYFVDFVGTEAADQLQACRLSPGALCHVDSPADIQRAFDDLIHDGLRGGAMAASLCSSRLQYLILRIAAALSPAHEDHTAAFSTYMRCRRHIEDHHLRLMQLQEVARECGVDEAYLCRLFGRYDRQSPYQYLTRLKMNRAAKQLEDQGRLVKQVAAELGYRDVFHFSRAFKNVFGVSPRGFRETFDDSRLSLPLSGTR
jgi:AraC-like DNA-binding protein